VRREKSGTRYVGNSCGEERSVHALAHCFVVLLCTLYFFQCYGQPYSKEQEAIDSIRQSDALFQMTISTSKNVKLAGLDVAISGMQTLDPGQLKFYIVVPDIIFDKFTSVTVKGPDGSSVSWPARIPPANRFVLRIPIQRSKTHTRR
jgi:hypothetical protein